MKMNTKTVWTISLLTLAAAGFIWQTARLQKAESASQVARAYTADLSKLQEELERLRKVEVNQTELVRLREGENTMKLEVARLRGQLGAALRTVANSSTQAMVQGLVPGLGRSLSSPGGDANDPSATAAGDGLKASADASATNLFLEAQMARARERLQLSPDQEQTIRGAVTKALQQGGENLKKVLSGEARTDEVPTQQEWALALEKEILAGLSPDQQAAYQKYKREDISANARLMANGEVLTVQNALGLSQEQQDQVFAVFYDHAVREMSGEPALSTARPREPLAAMEWQGDQKLKALETVLAPEQLATYRRMQEAYFQYMKGVFARAAARPRP